MPEVHRSQRTSLAHASQLHFPPFTCQAQSSSTSGLNLVPVSPAYFQPGPGVSPVHRPQVGPSGTVSLSTRPPRPPGRSPPGLRQRREGLAPRRLSFLPPRPRCLDGALDFTAAHLCLVVARAAPPPVPRSGPSTPPAPCLGAAGGPPPLASARPGQHPTAASAAPYRCTAPSLMPLLEGFDLPTLREVRDG